MLDRLYNEIGKPLLVKFLSAFIGIGLFYLLIQAASN
ncbi:hypothetical protein SAMN05518848_101960 [Paenibacillus sp. PDC88]|nr:hypothetical protein SAMN05518848_101960 [Paenibacillus sp. PDC88]